MNKAIQLFCFLTLLSTSTVFSQKKIALIVAISAYDKASSDWEPLHTDRDVKEITTALQKQGFSSENIKTIRDKDATKKNILSGINEYLYKKAAKGDLVYFHFSGHGQQVADYSGDETDRYDEALVPVDAKSKYEADGYKGENHLTDDELMASLNQVRQQIGSNGQLFMVIDACFSGGMLRGPGFRSVVRGSNDKMAPDYWQQGGEIPSSKQQPAPDGMDMSDNKKLAPVVAFMASQSTQPNAEYDGGGSLSRVVSEALLNMEAQMSFAGLFRLIRDGMAKIVPNQIPQADGNLNTIVFNGKAALVQPFYKVKASKEGTSTVWIMNGGSLHGLTVGSVVGFYAKEKVEDTTPPLFTTTIEYTQSIASFLTVVAPPAQVKDISTLWVYLQELAPSQDSIKVCVQIPVSELRAELESAIQKDPLLDLRGGEDCTCRIIQDPGSDSMDLMSAPEYLIRRVPAVASSVPIIMEDLRYYARAQFFRTLGSGPRSSGVSNDSIEISFIPVEVKYGKVVRELPITSFLVGNGAVVLPEGTNVRLRVRNASGVKGYFSLLDIQPNNGINVLMPAQNDFQDSPNDYHFNGVKGEVFEFPKNKNLYFTIGPPYGMDLLKLIVTDEPLDMRPILVSRGAYRGTPQQLSALERMFTDAMSATRSVTTNIPVREVGFFQSSFSIVKAAPQ